MYDCHLLFIVTEIAWGNRRRVVSSRHNKRKTTPGPISLKVFYLRSSSSGNTSVHLSVHPSICLSVRHTFFATTKQLYEWFSPSSVCPSVCPSNTHFPLCFHHHIIIKFSGVNTIDKSDAQSKGQGQRSRSQRSKQILPRLGRFRAITPVWIHIWLWNDA